MPNFESLYRSRFTLVEARLKYDSFRIELRSRCVADFESISYIARLFSLS